jgi:arylsulfatase A-like enzyme
VVEGWRSRDARVALAIAVLAAVHCGCAGGGARSGGGDSAPIRLADVFSTATVEGSPDEVAPLPRTEWVWSAAEGSGAATAGWRSLAGIANLRVEDGALRGTTQMPSPILGLDWSPPADLINDRIHSIEIRLRASGGTRVSFRIESAEQVFLPALLGPNPFSFPFTSPIVPGEEVKLYTLRPVVPMPLAGIRHLLVRPVDAAGVDFAIESLRVVLEREHLASIPAGLSWQGLQGQYRETLVARSPETLRFDVTLPANPYLELAVGTLTARPVTFEIAVGDGANGDGRRVRRTVTAPQRWDEVRVDLSDLGGRATQVALHVEAAEPGAIGLWGSPVVRSRVAGGKAPARPQGVVVVIIDTLRRDHLATWGYDRDTAPYLSSLAAEGAVADDAISQASWTKVSVPSILTSLYPTSHTVKDFGDLLPASAETLAEVFRKAGYATLGFSAIPFTGKMTNLHQGYEQFREVALDFSSSTANTIPNDKAARRYVDELLPWIERHREVPFFAMLHVEDPHNPYIAPESTATLWGKPGDAERYEQLLAQARPKVRHPFMQAMGMTTRAELEAAGVDAVELLRYERDAYDELIRSTDDEMKRLVERFDELGLRDRVLLAFTSDHGTELLDHGEHFHGHTVYGEINRVPMFFWGPSYVPGGVRIPVTVQNLDFMPTVLDLAGLDRPEAAQGQSLRPWFDAGGQESAAASKGWKRAPAITEKFSAGGRDPGTWESWAIVSDGWKLIHNVPPPPPAGAAPGGPPPGATPGLGPPGFGPPKPPPPEYELYDHVKDPLNHHDVAAEHPEKVKELSAQLARWLEQAKSQRLKSDTDLAAQASPEELERLRALGYL